jgi:hypothetical protein
MRPLNNPVGALVYNAHPGLVDTVLVHGKVVKRAGKLVGVDQEKVIRQATQTRDYLMEQAKSLPLISDARLGGDWRPAVTDRMSPNRTPGPSPDHSRRQNRELRLAEPRTGFSSSTGVWEKA